MKIFKTMVKYRKRTFIGSLIPVFIAICIAMPPLINYNLIEDNNQVSSCKSLKRMWEEDGSCGECMEWYRSDNIKGNDECTPVANITVPMNEHNAFISNGSTVILKCAFDTNVSCSWKRRDSNIAVDHNYRYIGAGNGSNTKDCNLQILKFRDFDVGDWICRSLATSSGEGRLGTHVYLSNEVIITARNYTTAYVQQWESIVLKCYFEEPVNCAWYRSNDTLEISERYSYIATNSSGHQTRDCSIKIESLQPQDMVTWKCQSMATSSKNATFSTIIRLRKTHSTIPRPEPIFVAMGEKISLNCTFSMPVNCKWTLHGRKLDAADKYTYNGSGTHTSDCNITIESIEERHFGEWTCSCDDCFDSEENATSWLIEQRCPSYYCEGATSGIYVGLIVCIVIIILLAVGVAVSVVTICKGKRPRTQPYQSHPENEQPNSQFLPSKEENEQRNTNEDDD